MQDLIYRSTHSLSLGRIAQPSLLYISKASVVKQSKAGVSFVNVSATTPGRTLSFQDECAVDTAGSTLQAFHPPTK